METLREEELSLLSDATEIRTSNYMHGDLFDLKDYWVAFARQSRDSDNFTQSKFQVLLDRLGGESEEVDGEVLVHRCSHWVCGWVEFILVRKDATDKVKILIENTERYNNYPLLDESDYSQRMVDSINEYWAGLSLSERLYDIKSYGTNDSIFSIRHDYVPEKLWDYYYDNF